MSAETEKEPFKTHQHQRQDVWLKDNRDAIAAYNRRVQEQGVFSDDVRRF